MDTAAFFRKWLRDMEDGQYDNGLLPAVIPYQGVEMMYKSTGTSVGWADAVYLIPYRYYKRYDDLELLKNCWPMMKKYGDYLMAHLGMSGNKAAKENPYNEYTYEKEYTSENGWNRRNSGIKFMVRRQSTRKNVRHTCTLQ